MHPFPHLYRAQAGAMHTGSVNVTTDAAPWLETNAPPEFGGPSGYWSPETLLVGSIADCYILSFRGVARASRLEWQSLAVDVEGVLDRVEGVTRFVRFTVKPRLSILSAEAEALARTVLQQAKRTCLITNSLTGECALEPTVSVAAEAAAG